MPQGLLLYAAGLLLYAASHNFADMALQLRNVQVDIDARDGTRIARPALWEAASQGHDNILQMLIDARADVNASTRSILI